MVTITCPWCEQQEQVQFDIMDGAETSFTCPECGTSVEFVEEPMIALDPAA